MQLPDEIGWIHTLDSVWTMCDSHTSRRIQKLLSYTHVYWVKKGFKKERMEYTVNMVHRRKGDNYFHTGFVQKVLNFCKSERIIVTYTSDIREMEFDEPFIKGIIFQPHQIEAINAGLKYGRGIIKAATGTGKSIVLAGLMSAFSQEKILFLVHNKDLIKQIKEEYLKKFKIGPYGELSGSIKDPLTRIMVATDKTFANLLELDISLGNYFDILLIDETHHVNSLENKYGFIIQRLAAPVKIGVTATLPNSEEGKMCLEALMGPILFELTMKEAVEELKILAIPTVKILKQKSLDPSILYNQDMVPIPEKHKNNPDWKPTKYSVVYWNGIVKNITRNIEILNEAEIRYLAGKSILISVVRIEHIRELLTIGNDYFPRLKISVVEGITGEDEREKIKKDLEAKRIKCVLATTVWSEGVDIKSLDVVILAGSGKSEIKTLQNLGRGLRKTKRKTTVEVIDFWDQSEYLSDHYRERKKVYLEMGWIKPNSERSEK